VSVVIDRVKEALIPKRNIGSADLPFRGYECVGGAPLLSVTRGQCNVTPMVIFLAAKHHLP